MTTRKKKIAFERILNDLMNSDVLEAPTTVSHLQTKIISLQRAHECAAAVEAKSGPGTSGFPFMTIMNQIFGAPLNPSQKPMASASASSLTIALASPSTIASAPSSSSSSRGNFNPCISL